MPIGLYWADDTTSLVRVEGRKTIQEAADESVSKLVDQVCDQYGYPDPSTHESDRSQCQYLPLFAGLWQSVSPDHPSDRLLLEARTDESTVTDSNVETTKVRTLPSCSASTREVVSNRARP